MRFTQWRFLIPEGHTYAYNNQQALVNLVYYRSFGMKQRENIMNNIFLLILKIILWPLTILNNVLSIIRLYTIWGSVREALRIIFGAKSMALHYYEMIVVYWKTSMEVLEALHMWKLLIFFKITFKILVTIIMILSTVLVFSHTSFTVPHVLWSFGLTSSVFTYFLIDYDYVVNTLEVYKQLFKEMAYRIYEAIAPAPTESVDSTDTNSMAPEPDNSYNYKKYIVLTIFFIAIAGGIFYATQVADNQQATSAL